MQSQNVHHAYENNFISAEIISFIDDGGYLSEKIRPERDRERETENAIKPSTGYVSTEADTGSFP